MKLITNWKDAGKFYSVQAALIGGAILSGIGAVQLFGVTVPQVYVYAASFLTISSFVVLRLVSQDKTATPELPAIPKADDNDQQP